MKLKKIALMLLASSCIYGFSAQGSTVSANNDPVQIEEAAATASPDAVNILEETSAPKATATPAATPETPVVTSSAAPVSVHTATPAPKAKNATPAPKTVSPTPKATSSSKSSKEKSNTAKSNKANKTTKETSDKTSEASKASKTNKTSKDNKTSKNSKITKEKTTKTSKTNTEKKKVVKKPSYTKGELRLMASIINCEAGAECYQGKVAVGIVVMNRVKSASFPNTIRGVVYQKFQFSPVRNGSLKRRLAQYDSGRIHDSQWKACISAAKKVLEGQRTIIMKGKIKNMQGVHFFSVMLANSKFKLGGHRFK